MNQQERLLELLYSLPFGIVEFDSGGEVTAVNPMTSNLLMPLVGAAAFGNAFRLLDPLLPELRTRLSDAGSAQWFVTGRCESPGPDGTTRILQGHIKALGERFIAVISDETELHEHAVRLQEEHRRMLAVLDGTGAGTWEWNVETGEVRFNARWAEIVGYSLEELMPLSIDTWSALAHPDDLAESEAKLQAHFRGELPTYELVGRIRHKDGHWVWVRDSGRLMTRTASGEPEWMYGTHIDVTESKRQELDVAQARDKFQAIAESTGAGLLAVDSSGEIDYLNSQFTKLFGYSKKDMQDRQGWILRAAPDELTQEALKSIFPSPGKSNPVGRPAERTQEIRLRTTGGVFRSVLMSVKPTVYGVVATFSDISEQKQHEDYIRYVSQHDTLTGLPGRALLSERLDWHCRQTRRGRWLLCVCFIDLDGFKEINDSLGHAAGDAVLQAVASRMQSTIREADTLARLGGDEFVIAFTELESQEQCLPLVERVLENIRAPIPYGDRMVQVSGSIGLAFYSHDPTVDGDQLLRRADQAMYKAKLKGKNQFSVFDVEEDVGLQQRHVLLAEITSALAADEFALHYQPQIDLATGAVIGIEALLRWPQQDGRYIPPDEFLPAVHDHERSEELGAWVMRRALRDLETLHQHGIKLAVSINVFPRQMASASFIEELGNLLKHHPSVPADDVYIEVVETTVLGDTQATKTAMLACKELGIHFALDDFGTGYSSLAHLRSLPIEVLKIDKSFIDDMLEDANDLAIVEGILSLAKAFGQQVVAEGVETIEQGLKLKALGCDQAQGYCIARPMPLDQLVAWLEQWTPPRKWV